MEIKIKRLTHSVQRRLLCRLSCYLDVSARSAVQRYGLATHTEVQSLIPLGYREYVIGQTADAMVDRCGLAQSAVGAGTDVTWELTGNTEREHG